MCTDHRNQLTNRWQIYIWKVFHTHAVNYNYALKSSLLICSLSDRFDFWSKNSSKLIITTFNLANKRYIVYLDKSKTGSLKESLIWIWMKVSGMSENGSTRVHHHHHHHRVKMDMSLNSNKYTTIIINAIKANIEVVVHRTSQPLHRSAVSL